MKPKVGIISKIISQCKIQMTFNLFDLYFGNYKSLSPFFVMKRKA